MTHAVGNAALLQTTLDATERAATTQKTSSAVAANMTVAAQSSSTTISDAASVLSVSATDSDVRTGRVEALKAAIASGSYSVPASDVADKLIGNMLG